MATLAITAGMFALAGLAKLRRGVRLWRERRSWREQRRHFLEAEFARLLSRRQELVWNIPAAGNWEAQRKSVREVEEALDEVAKERRRA